MNTSPDFLSCTDQLGETIRFRYPPERIVSVVPSQTELLFDLGLSNAIAGVTWFCIHPAEARQKAQVGGTKNLKPEKIAALNPDLILANKEENDQAQIEWLAERFPVWTSNIKNLEDALQMIASVGKMTGTEVLANDIIDKVTIAFSALQPLATKNALYLIWKDPYMSIGSDTFIHDMMGRAGLRNVIQTATRYPELSESLMKELNPEVVLLSSEPFPFKERHIPEIQAILPGAKVCLVDGEMFSWYGSRLLKVPEYLQHFREIVNS